MKEKKALFSLGMVCCTPGALLQLVRFGIDGRVLLARHVSGDFGDLCDEDKASNTAAIAEGARVFSCYVIAPCVKLYVITEADRSATTLLLPSEY